MKHDHDPTFSKILKKILERKNRYERIQTEKREEKIEKKRRGKKMKHIHFPEK
jgi:hypothetical protein